MLGIENEFTPEEWEHIRTHHGMTSFEERSSDLRPAVPLEPGHSEPRTLLCEGAHSAPGNQRRYRTGRNQQINIKATPQVIERLYKMADAKRVPLGELLEQALDALEKSSESE